MDETERFIQVPLIILHLVESLSCLLIAVASLGTRDSSPASLNVADTLQIAQLGHKEFQ